jgi:hypothetical protein
MTDAGLPPDLPGEARPNYGASTPPGYTAPPAASSAASYPPPYAPAQQGYTPPQYPPPNSGGMSTGAKVGLFTGLGCLALAILPVLIIVIIGIVAAASGVGNSSDYDPWEPPTTDDGSPSDGNTVGDVEWAWKSGDDWLAAPADEAQPANFLPGYSTAEEWLQYNMGAGYDFNVVFTADPAYNCGMAKATPDPTWVIGCYEPAYGKTLFIWWGDQATDDMKALILLHEYSHFWQNWENFDATRSAADAGLFDDPAFVQDVWETDATCRVYDDWHYTNLRYLDGNTLSPCGDTGWGEHWFENELLELGVTVTDY